MNRPYNYLFFIIHYFSLMHKKKVLPKGRNLWYNPLW